MRQWIGGACVALLALALGPGLEAQERAGFGETVEVQLVLVDVWVADRSGEPVLDLAREEFRLFEDGKRVEISQFSAPRAPSPVATIAGGGSERPVRAAPARLVIFVDNLHIGAVARQRVFTQVWEVLKDNLRPHDEVMVASYEGSVKVELAPTTDRRRLRKALEEQTRLRARALVADLGEERVLQLIESTHSDSIRGDSRLGNDPCVHLGHIARTYAEQVHARVLGSISALRDFVNSLAAYPGRKTLLHVSDGIPLVAGLSAYRFAIELCDGSGGGVGLRKAVDTSTFGPGKYTRWDPATAWAELTHYDTTDEWRGLTADANSYQVSLYTLQAGGFGSLRRSGVDQVEVSMRTEQDVYRNDQDALFLAADETGGRAMLDINDFGPGLTAMLQDGVSAYQLAYVPPTQHDGRTHSIRVELSREDLEVRHRRSYVSKQIHERVIDGILSSIYHGLVQNPLRARLEVARVVPIDKRKSNVTMRVRVPLASLLLLPDGGASSGLFSVFVRAWDTRGNLTPIGQKTIPVRVSAEGLKQDPEREFVYEIEIPLDNRDHQVVVAIRDELGESSSYLVRQVPLGD